MRAAPPVEVLAALRGGWWVAACSLWWGAASCVAVWLAWHLTVRSRASVSAELPLLLALLLVALGALAGAAAVLFNGRRSPMRLSWDGSQWFCVAARKDDSVSGLGAQPGQVDLMLDFGAALLLRWHAPARGDEPARTRWLPLARQGQSTAWHGLRVALSLPSPRRTLDSDGVLL